jgi:hypothetical protein
MPVDSLGFSPDEEIGNLLFEGGILILSARSKLGILKR